MNSSVVPFGYYLFYPTWGLQDGFTDDVIQDCPTSCLLTAYLHLKFVSCTLKTVKAWNVFSFSEQDCCLCVRERDKTPVAMCFASIAETDKNVINYYFPHPYICLPGNLHLNTCMPNRQNSCPKQRAAVLIDIVSFNYSIILPLFLVYYRFVFGHEDRNSMSCIAELSRWVSAGCKASIAITTACKLLIVHQSIICLYSHPGVLVVIF